MKTSLAIACVLAIVALSNALPIERVEVDPTVEIGLLDLEQEQPNESPEEVKRVARGLGFGGLGFGGHGFGLGGLGGLGGGLGHGLGGFGLHGLGGFGGFGGGFKSPFLFKGF